MKWVWPVTAVVCSASVSSAVSPLVTEIVSQVEAFAKKSLQDETLVDPSSTKSGPSEYPYFNIFPAFLSSLVKETDVATWSSPCFGKNEAFLRVLKDEGELTITVTSSEPLVGENSAEKQEKCEDFYLFATAAASLHAVITPNRQSPSSVTSQISIVLPEDITDAEWFDIDNKGVRISIFPFGPVTTFSNMLETVALFIPEVTDTFTEVSNARIMDFMNSYTNFDPIVEVDPSSFVLPDASEIHSGDFFGLLQLSGIGAMMGWATGSTTGHTFISQWMDGVLYMCESTTPAVQCTEYTEFMESHRHSSQIVWAPLKEEYRSIYNETAAAEFFKSVEGVDYGFRTMLFGWMDDEILNLPCLPPDFSSNCGSWAYFETSLAEIDRKTNFGEMIWNPGMAKRLNVSDKLRTAELYQVAAEQGIETLDVLRIPEQDSWVYNTTRYGEPYVSKDMVCDVFVCNMWKAGGLFGELVDEINCGEMVNWDVYALEFLQPTYTQIMGNHTLKLQFDYASKLLYPHMAESCSSSPPDYVRDPNC